MKKSILITTVIAVTMAFTACNKPPAEVPETTTQTTLQESKSTVTAVTDTQTAPQNNALDKSSIIGMWEGTAMAGEKQVICSLYLYKNDTVCYYYGFSPDSIAEYFEGTYTIDESTNHLELKMTKDKDSSGDEYKNAQPFELYGEYKVTVDKEYIELETASGDELIEGITRIRFNRVYG